MQPDLGSTGEEGLHEARAQPVVHVRCRAVRRMAMAGHEVERMRHAARLRDPQDALEAPVRVGSPQLVERHGGERARLARGLAAVARARGVAQSRRSASHSDRRPAPGRVDVVRETHGKMRAGPPRRLEAELPAQSLDRWVERVEAARGAGKAPVLVALPVQLLHAGEVEEGLREIVSGRPLAPGQPLPGLLDVRHVVAEPGVAGTERVEDPTRTALHLRRRVHATTRRRMRATWASAGLGSSSASTASV